MFQHFLFVFLYFKVLNSGDFSDIINLIISGAGILFAVLCIFNSKSALQTIIIILGIAFTILGCISLYQALTSKKDNISNDDTETSHFIIEDNTSS
ncbi:MAG TPA: hypothetical protein DCS12_08675 [Clostridiales bacterium]|nr:hypothetical protein [Clostridiales bacterium]